MSVTVATPEPDAPATRALIAEGVDVDEVICVGEYGYGRLVARLWNAGSPFVVCEWDIIPWPGAIDALFACPGFWCTYRYPLHPGQITTSFGIGKYRPDGPAPAQWRETAWDRLDGALVPTIRARLSSEPCVHEPPVAHARRDFETREPREAR